MSCSPSDGVGLLAVLTTVTLATFGELIVALADVTPLGFAVVCDSVTVLVTAPDTLTVATIVRVAVLPLARVPTCHARVRVPAL